MNNSTHIYLKNNNSQLFSYHIKTGRCVRPQEKSHPHFHNIEGYILLIFFREENGGKIKEKKMMVTQGG